MKKGKIAKCIFVVLFLILLPLIFYYSFDTGEASYFFDIESKIGVSNWIGFWISYITLLVTVILTYQTYRLTIKMDRVQLYNKIESDRLKLRISCIELINFNKGLRIRLPLDVISLSHVKVTKAYIVFGKDEELIFEDMPFELSTKCSFSLFFPKSLGAPIQDALDLWLDQCRVKNYEYNVACLKVFLSYDFQPIGKEKKIDICSQAEIKIEENNELEDQIVIIDSGVIDFSVYN